MDNLDTMEAYDSNRKNIKIKVTSAEIIVRKIDGNPYYEIKHYKIGDDEEHIGYGSYNLNFVLEWLEKCFEIVNTDE